MNEATNTKIAAEALPRWWFLSDTDKGQDDIQILDALGCVASRLRAQGTLLADVEDIETETANEVGDMLIELADGLDAFRKVANERRTVRLKAAKAAEPKPDMLSELRDTSKSDAVRRVAEMFVKRAREEHAAVIAEIEAGERGEEDRAEADQLLAAVLAVSGHADGAAWLISENRA